MDLWYAEAGGIKPDIPFDVGGYTPDFSYKLTRCGTLYPDTDFPNPPSSETSRPFEAFGFNQGKKPYNFQFLIDKGTALPINFFLSLYNFFLSPDLNDKDYLELLTPVQLQVNGHPPFGLIETGWMGYNPEVNYIQARWDPASVSTQDIQAYRQTIQSSGLNFHEMDFKDVFGYELDSSVFWIAEDGSMTLRSCQQ